MVADQSAANFERMATEMGTFTFLYWRVNPDGLIVRDAKFIEDAGSYDVAVSLFAGHMAGVDTGLCAVLRGRVNVADDIERADQPEMNYAAHEHLKYLNRAAGFQDLDQYTVYGSWNTGDGHRRYMKVTPALNAQHAEMIVRADLTEGQFLVAGVAEGCVPNEDTEELWATLDGQLPTPAATRQPWWRFW